MVSFANLPTKHVSFFPSVVHLWMHCGFAIVLNARSCHGTVVLDENEYFHAKLKAFQSIFSLKCGTTFHLSSQYR